MIEMISEPTPERRAAIFGALADEHRLRVVDSLMASDRTPGELAEITGLASNLLAFHLRTLERVGLIERRRSEGDARRRYVHLRLDELARAGPLPANGFEGGVIFVCTHNSARSQFAEAVWRARGGEAWSAGTEPSRRVHPQAVVAGRRFGVSLEGLSPKGYESVPTGADLIVSVCDRALEAGIPLVGTRLHWSIPDPVRRGPEAFDVAFSDIARRVARLRGAG